MEAGADDLKEAALRSGYFLRATASCSAVSNAGGAGSTAVGEQCKWTMNSTDGAPLNHPFLNSSLYYGPPGVSLFFSQLADATLDRRWRDQDGTAAIATTAAYVASGDAVHAYKSNVGLHYGLAGLAFALRSASATKAVPAAAAAADQLEMHILQVAPFSSSLSAPLWNNTDVAHGVSGTGLYLLWASKLGTQQRPQRPEEPMLTPSGIDNDDSRQPPLLLLDAAVRAGEWLLSRAEVPPPGGGGGLRWARGPDTDGSHDGDYYPTFCCGTAGVGYFLAELALSLPQSHARRAAFLDAALAAGKHVLGVAAANTTADEMLVKHGEQGVDLDLYYIGWCGGGAGWSRLFVKLYEATMDLEWLEHVKQAAVAIQQQALPTGAMYLPTPKAATPWRNLGQCCGLAAVGTFMLQLATSQLPFPNSTKTAALHSAMQIASSVLRAAVPAGGNGGITFPNPEEHMAPSDTRWQVGWMQGTAGVASFLLHAHAVSTGNMSGTRKQWPDEPWPEAF
eukprot:gene16816-25097_t